MRYIVFTKSSYQRLKPHLFLILCAVIVFVVLKVFVLEIYRIPTSSMQPTLVEGDHILGLKRFSIKKGDIVAVKRQQDSSIYVKRVAATQNETISMKAGSVFVNGKKLKLIFDDDTKKYRYIENSDVVYKEFNGDSSYSVLYSNTKRPVDISKEYKVSDAGLFLLGDNRVNSVDSRTWGEVKRSDVVSKIVLIWFSMDPDTKKIRWDRIGLVK